VGVDNPEVYYRTLGLEPGASREEVKRAYRDLVKLWHPDRVSQDSGLQQQALAHIQRINDAYDKLQRRLCGSAVHTSQPQSRPQPASPRSAPDRAQTDSSHPHQTRQRLPAIPTWLVALVAFVGLRLGLDLSTPTSPTIRHDFTSMPSPVPSPSPNAVPSTMPGRSASVRGREVRTTPRPEYKVRLAFTVGSTKDEVLTLQGTPTRFSERVWEYGLSRVYFDNGRVTRWDEWPRDPLKARPTPPPTGP
jgi:hypothetical protein